MSEEGMSGEGSGEMSGDGEAFVGTLVVANGMLPCPECGKEYNGPQGLGAHRKAAHGVAGEYSRSGAKRSKPKPKSKVRATCEVCGKEVRADNLRRHTDTVHGSAPVEAQAHDYDTDDIFTTVVTLLYAHRDIPVKDLPVLVEWREATARMLEKLV